MWSVTEQNHLHYPGVMFHCLGLVLWWPATHLSASTSPPLLLRVSILCKCMVMKGSIFSKTFFHWFLVYFTLLPSITFFEFHLALQCQNRIASSFFAVLALIFLPLILPLPWDVAICLHSLAWLLFYTLFLHLLLQKKMCGVQIPAALPLYFPLSSNVRLCGILRCQGFSSCFEGPPGISLIDCCLNISTSIESLMQHCYVLILIVNHCTAPCAVAIKVQGVNSFRIIMH